MTFLLLTAPLVLPIGPMYWDVYVYFDAANRISHGQVPVNDFFTPVGPLGYYLFAGWLTLFPNGQPALLAQWSTLTVTAPMMAVVLWDVVKRSRPVAFALLIPFLFFALLPFNTQEYYPLPGTDAFGTYNRQVCQLLYVLVAAVIFMRNRRLLAAVMTLNVAALFFIKITGFVAGVILASYTFLSGRLRPRETLAAVVSFVVLLGVVELGSGLVSNYISDVLALIALNSTTLLPRFLQAASLNFGVVVTTGAVASLLLWVDRWKLITALRSARYLRKPGRFTAILNHPGLWLMVTLCAGVISETQNLGSQALVFLWPVFLWVLTRIRRYGAHRAIVVSVAVLTAAAMLPPVVSVSERAARTFVGSSKAVALSNHNLKTLGSVNMRPEVAQRAERMLKHDPVHRAAYDAMVAMDEEPTPLLYSDEDFQILYLQAVDQAIDAIHRLETDRGVRFETIMSLNFVNPFPWLMDRTAPRAITIGADPRRAVPNPGPAEEQAISAADLVLYPTCPPTVSSAMLLDLYSPALADHRRIRLSSCYDAFVRPSLMTKLIG